MRACGSRWARRTRRRPRPSGRSRPRPPRGSRRSPRSSSRVSGEGVPQASLPLLPPPDLTFFPRTMLPLHIFEARYRAMITDCLARDERLAVVGLKPGYEAADEGQPPVYEVGGAGRVVQWERLPTGRYNLLLRGDCRVRIDRELPADTLYRMVAATPLEETGAEGPTVGGRG